MSNKGTLGIIIGVTVVSLAIYLILGWCAAYVLSAFGVDITVIEGALGIVVLKAIFSPGTSDSRKKINL